MVTTTTELVDTGEKRDRRGRRISSAEWRAGAVAAWRDSGLTMAAFARREGIEYSTFAGWVLKAARKRSPVKRPRFAEVRGAGVGRRQSCLAGGTAAGWDVAAWCQCRGTGRIGEGVALMLAFPHSVRIFVAILPVDMRKSFNGLWAAASEQLHEDPKAVQCSASSTRSARG